MVCANGTLALVGTISLFLSNPFLLTYSVFNPTAFWEKKNRLNWSCLQQASFKFDLSCWLSFIGNNSALASLFMWVTLLRAVWTFHLERGFPPELNEQGEALLISIIQSCGSEYAVFLILLTCDWKVFEKWNSTTSTKLWHKSLEKRTPYSTLLSYFLKYRPNSGNITAIRLMSLYVCATWFYDGVNCFSHCLMLAIHI